MDDVMVIHDVKLYKWVFILFKLHPISTVIKVDITNVIAMKELTIGKFVKKKKNF